MHPLVFPDRYKREIACSSLFTDGHKNIGIKNSQLGLDFFEKALNFTNTNP